MKKLQNYIQNLSFTERSVPLGLLLTCVIGFGLLIPSLGFYMDDWPYVFYSYNNSTAGLKEMLVYDSRPGAIWLYTLFFSLLKYKPLHWHIMTLLLRWATVVVMWTTLRKIWPARAREATHLALLFSVYPFFLLQPSPVGYTHIWVGFTMYGLSLWLMIQSLTDRKYYVQATAGATLLVAAHLFTSEYFAGL